jgi:hypothetical protein
MREVRQPRYLEWAQELSGVTTKVLAGWLGEEAEPPRDFFPSIIHSVCLSHAERLSAAIILNKAGLGHHAAPLVRIAYEENSWLHYLSTIEDRALRNELLNRLAGLNKSQRVKTQRSFFGSDEPVAAGFLEQAHEDLAPQFARNEERMEEIAELLDWPPVNKRGGRAGGLPSIAWIAENRFGIKRHPIHTFLADASSQYVHFSAYTVMRGVGQGPDGRAIHGDPFQRGVDAGFALGWLTHQLIDCFLEAKKWVAPHLDFEGDWLQHWPTQMQRIQRDLGRYGLPALMYAADFPLRD